jgi:hypothetical protein
VQTGFGARPASYAMGKGGSIPGLKRPKPEANNSPATSSDVKNVGLFIHSPILLQGVVLNQLSTGTIYLFYYAGRTETARPTIPVFLPVHSLPSEFFYLDVA